MIFLARVISVRVGVIFRSKVIVVQGINMFNFSFTCSSPIAVDGQMVIGTTDGTRAQKVHY
jgi:hypothetical protein